MDTELKKWFVAERAKALAMVLLTRRNDLVVTETKEESGLDLTVHVRTGEDRSTRPFGVYLTATMNPVTIETTNSQLKPVMAKVQSRGPFHYPVCVFYFMVKEDQGYYTWAAEPVVTDNGQPRLKLHADADCNRLDNESLEEIVCDVNRWYDAFYETITT